MGGLSRSGSTLLSAILQQNPNIYVSENSPICDLTYKLNLLFDHNPQYNSSPDEKRRINVLRNLIDNYYFDVKKPIIIDKFRSWGTPYNISMIQSLYTENVKIICPTRNIIEILASFLKLIKENKNHHSFVDKEIEKNYSKINIENLDDLRCEVLVEMDGGIRHQLYALQQCMDKSYKDFFHLVEYDNLIENTKGELGKIYDFLGLEYYAHDYEKINYKSKSKDTDYFGVPNLHKVRSKIFKTSPDPQNILSEKIIKKYSGLEFWRI